MEITLSKSAQKECVKYAKYITKGKNSSDTEIDNIAGQFESFVKHNISNITKHEDTVYPEDCMYGKGYKMFIHDEKRRVIFYEIKRNGDIMVHECPHTTDLVKNLKKKKIKPKEDANPEMLLKLLELERGDMVAALPDDGDGELPEDVRKEFEERKEELKKKLNSNSKYEEDTDSEGNPRQHKTGPKGGKYYRVKKDGKWGPWNSDTNESIRNINTIKESKMVGLVEYIKNRLVG